MFSRFLNFLWKRHITRSWGPLCTPERLFKIACREWNTHTANIMFEKEASFEKLEVLLNVVLQIAKNSLNVGRLKIGDI